MGRKTTPELERVASEKRTYDQKMLLLDQEYKRQKAALKEPVLNALEDALNAGGSVNNVAVTGMGYAAPGVSALKAFTGATGTSREALLAAVTGGIGDPSVTLNIAASVSATPEVYKWSEFENTTGRVTYSTHELGGQKFEVTVQRNAPHLEARTDAKYTEDKAEAGAILKSFAAHTNGTYTFDAEDQAILYSAD